MYKFTFSIKYQKNSGSQKHTAKYIIVPSCSGIIFNNRIAQNIPRIPSPEALHPVEEQTIKKSNVIRSSPPSNRAWWAPQNNSYLGLKGKSIVYWFVNAFPADAASEFGEGRRWGGTERSPAKRAAPFVRLLPFWHKDYSIWSQSLLMLGLSKTEMAVGLGRQSKHFLVSPLLLLVVVAVQLDKEDCWDSVGFSTMNWCSAPKFLSAGQQGKSRQAVSFAAARCSTWLPTGHCMGVRAGREI